MSKKITVWQCQDWCCETKPFSKRWWNARVQGQGGYHSAGTQQAAYLAARANQ